VLDVRGWLTADVLFSRFLRFAAALVRQTAGDPAALNVE
jgi:hypothetical protein